MSPHDDPLDPSAVAADEAAVEALHSGRPLRDPDRALDLLHALVHDVERDLPGDRPVGAGGTVITFASDGGRPRHTARTTAVVAAVAAGVLTLSGVAAASTLVPAGSPLHGLGETVRAAAGAVVRAVTPPESADGEVRPAAPAPSASPTARPTAAPAPPAPRPPAPGRSVAPAARSSAAAAQVDRLLDEAEALLDDGRTTTAVQRLDLAERRLAEVLPSERPLRAARLEALRDRADRAQTSQPRETAKPARATPAPAPKSSQAVGRTAQPRQAGRPSAPPRETKGAPGQSDRDASAKPRA